MRGMGGNICEESLKYLSSSSSCNSVCFPKLDEIEIDGTNKVRWLLSYSLASHCPSIEKLRISNCSQLERLVDGYSDKEAAHGDHLLLLKLKYLTLEILPKLKEIFGGGFESFHNKQECSQQGRENERVRVVNSKLCSIRLEDLPELEYIWKGYPPQIVSLHTLEFISLDACPRLKNMFTLDTSTSFPKLRVLVVNECKEWEGIFCEESVKNISSSSSSSIVCFPRLEWIRIYDCHKVKKLFSYSLASHCPSLKKITIHDCYQLEGVVQVCYEGEVIHERLFPKLNDLDLQRLPKLREIYPGYEFPLLSGTVEIEDCPNICNIPLEYKASSDLEIESES